MKAREGSLPACHARASCPRLPLPALITSLGEGLGVRTTT